MSANKWRELAPLWFVADALGLIWISTGSFTKRRAIRNWKDQAGGDWSDWYGRGYRCFRAKIKYAKVQ